MTKNEATLYSLALTIVHTLEDKFALEKEVAELRAQNKSYKEQVYNHVYNTPHPAEAMLTLIAAGSLTLHPKEDEHEKTS